MPVYDPETDSNKDLGNLSPSELRDMEQHYSSPRDKREDKAIEGGANPDDLENKGMGRKLRLKDQEEEQGKQDPYSAIDDKLNATQEQDRAAGANPLTDFYKPSETAPSGLIGKAKFLSKKRGLIAGAAGVGVIGIVVAMMSMFGFLNVFKLDHIMKNIEMKAFTRYQVSMDHRSDKWIRSYLMLRLAEIEDPNLSPKDRQNVIFRANKVDTDNPLKDWYSTMRTSKFEDDLYEKHGIKFASSFDAAGKFRPAIIKLKDTPVTFDLTATERAAVESGDINKFNGRLSEFIDVEVLGGDKAARKEIKKAVDAETKAWQVIKRRHIRKNIQNMTGIRDWRFFEKTRDKLNEKKISVRNKIIRKALPESTKTGKLVQCLMGMSECRGSSDPIDAENRATGSPDITGTKDGGRSNDSNPNDPNAANPVAGEVDGAGRAVSEGIQEGTSEAAEVVTKDASGKIIEAIGVKAAVIKAIVSKINVVTSIVSIVDMLARIDKGIQDKSLIKLVSAARAAQAVGMFSTYMIASDQLKTGEVTGPEVGKFMETINSVSNSEGWTSVIGSSKDVVKAESSDFKTSKNRNEYCSTEHQAAIQDPANHAVAEKEFHYLCGSMQIGGTSAAQTITDWWTNTIGAVIGPVLSVYRASPIGSILNFFNSVVGFATDFITNTLIRVLGLQGTIENVMGWIIGEVASALGAGPMMNGTEPSGVFLNQMVQGGASSAESSARYQGAAKTNKQTAELAREYNIAYLKENSGNQSIVSKYLSLDNQNSVLSRSLFATVSDGAVTDMIGKLAGLIKLVAKIPLSLFSKPVNATTADPYSAANFAGIDTYDFPKECYDLDPLTMKPADVTNANTILTNKFTDAELTWDLVNNNTAFYDAVYAKIGKVDNADDIATKIYDCAALDTAVRGGMGAMYGYTNDNGLDANAPLNTDTSSNPSADPLKGGDTTNISCQAGTDLGVAEGYNDNIKTMIRTCNVQGIIVNSQISKNIDQLLNASKLSAIKLSGGGFRTMEGQIQARISNGCPDIYISPASSCKTPTAIPGYSNHQMGLAIDFECGGSLIRSRSSVCFTWLNNNAAKFGLKNLPSEEWHWSVDGR